MYYLIYTSHSKYQWSNESLKDLLIQSVENNRSLGITGMLVFLRERFIQLLEGEEEKVKQLFKKIISDSRHERVDLILEGNTKERIFKDWSMGFKLIDDQEFTDLTGYESLNQFFSKAKISNHSHPALIFLKLFYDKNYRDFVSI
jgi:hypothetical protein